MLLKKSAYLKESSLYLFNLLDWFFHALYHCHWQGEPPYERRDRTPRTPRESEHHHNGDRYDPRYDQLRSREYHQADRPREQRPPSTGQQHRQVDPDLVQRNPMVDAFPKGKVATEFVELLCDVFKAYL